MKRTQQQYVNKYITNANKTRKQPSLKLGQRVKVANYHKKEGNVKSLTQRFDGPYTVTRFSEDGTGVWVQDDAVIPSSEVIALNKQRYS